MIRTMVSSRRIRSVGWQNNTLEVEFCDGKIYQYYDVNENEYIAFMSSSSLGSALSKLDKTHRYRPIN